MRRKADKILVVDVESTCWEGFPPKGESSEIIEIGIAPVDLRNNRIEKAESISVLPETSNVSDYCTELTGINIKTLKDKGISYKDAVRKLREEYNSAAYAMTSWGDYDRNMFYRMSDMHSVDYPFSPTHINLKYLFSVWVGMIKLVGLRNAMEKLDIEFDGRQHCGKDDAYNTAKILVKMLKSFPDLNHL